MVCLLVLALLIDLYLFVLSVTRLDRSRATYFIFLTVAFLIYTLGYLAEILTQTPEGMLAALRVENFAIPFIAPLFWLTVTSLFRSRLYGRWQFIAAMVYGLAMFFLVLTNDGHQLYYASVSTVSDGTSNYVALGYGPLYILNQIVSFSLMIMTYVVMVVRFVSGSKKLRNQIVFALSGAVIGFAGNVLNISGLMPYGLDPTPITMSLGMLCFSISIVRYDLFGVVARAVNTAVETMDDGYIVLDNDADFLYCNRSARRLFPELKHFDGTDSIYKLPGWPEALAQLTDDCQTVFELSHDDIHTRSYRVRVRKVLDNAGRPVGWSVAIHDITDETAMISQLERLASTDALTGIYNRRHVLEMTRRELEAATRMQQKTALMMFDIDWFKRINDTYGHSTGDKVLRAVAGAVQSSLRAYDIFGRTGGEEFVVFSRSSGMDGLMQFAERLRRTIEALVIETDTGEIHCTASFGVVEIPPGSTLQDVINAADVAMYQAKAQGRNCAVAGNLAGGEAPPASDIPADL